MISNLIPQIKEDIIFGLDATRNQDHRISDVCFVAGRQHTALPVIGKTDRMSMITFLRDGSKEDGQKLGLKGANLCEMSKYVPSLHFCPLIPCNQSSRGA